MRLAGVPYAVGREAATEYNESAGGVRLSWGDIPASINPFMPDGRTLIPLVEPWNGKGLGDADDKVQCMTYRLCITNHSSNRVPFPLPQPFVHGQFELVARWFAAMDRQARDAMTMHEYFLMREIVHPDGSPTGKWDLNSAVDANGGKAAPVGVDAPGLQYEYPVGNFSTRQRIIAAHRQHIAALLHYLANSPAVPAQLRAEVGAYGLCKDSFADTEHWPPQLYVRESIRMKGAAFLTQEDIMRPPQTCKNDSVLLSHWGLDVHLVQRTTSNGTGPHVPPSSGGLGTAMRVINEGRPLQDHSLHPSIAEIPFEALIPRREDARNLLVPVCISASHVAFTTYRMETQYMSAGHAVGVAAALAVSAGGVAVQDVSVRMLQAELGRQGVIFHTADCGVPLEFVCGADRCFQSTNVPNAYLNGSCDDQCEPLLPHEWLIFKVHWRVSNQATAIVATADTALKKSAIDGFPSGCRRVAKDEVVHIFGPPRPASNGYWLVTVNSTAGETRALQ